MIIGYKVDIKIIPELVSEKMQIAEHCVASVGHEEPKENPFCLIIGSIFQSSGEMAFYIWPKLRIAFDICIGKFFRGITLMPIIFNTDNTDVSIVHAKGRGSEWLTKINQNQFTDYIGLTFCSLQISSSLMSFYQQFYATSLLFLPVFP